MPVEKSNYFGIILGMCVCIERKKNPEKESETILINEK